MTTDEFREKWFATMGDAVASIEANSDLDDVIRKIESGDDIPDTLTHGRCCGLKKCATDPCSCKCLNCSSWALTREAVGAKRKEYFLHFNPVVKAATSIVELKFLPDHCHSDLEQALIDSV